MTCNTCLKINPLPSCIDTDEFYLTGITFPDYVNEVIIIRITDTATGRVDNMPILTDGSGAIVDGFEVSTLYPLMQHWYKIEFIAQGSPANFLLTNPDATESTGCCMEFFATDLTASDNWPLSSLECKA